MFVVSRVALTSAAFAAVAIFSVSLTSPAWASGCDAGDRIDGSSMETAKKKIEKAGFHKVTDLKKSCDNFWHARADKDGAMINIALSPQGDVMIEGN
jgi:hypothetical protein